MGADDYLIKPFDSEILLFKIKSILKRKISLKKQLIIRSIIFSHHLYTIQNLENYNLKMINLSHYHQRKVNC